MRRGGEPVRGGLGVPGGLGAGREPAEELSGALMAGGKPGPIQTPSHPRLEQLLVYACLRVLCLSGSPIFGARPQSFLTKYPLSLCALLFSVLCIPAPLGFRRWPSPAFHDCCTSLSESLCCRRAMFELSCRCCYYSFLFSTEPLAMTLLCPPPSTVFSIKLTLLKLKAVVPHQERQRPASL